MYPTAHMAKNAAYEVIAVPMMQGFAFNQLQPLDWQNLPYATGAVDVAYVDRRIIPITSPLTVQHVVACLNFTGSKFQNSVSTSNDGYDNPYNVASSARPLVSYVDWQPSGMSQMRSGDPLFEYQIGVGVVTGEAADNFAYGQVAYGSFSYERDTTSRFTSPLLIDVVDMDLDALLRTDSAEVFEDASYKKYGEQFLVSVPVRSNGDTGDTGKGFWSNYEKDFASAQYDQLKQGKPYFVGEAAKYALGRKTPVSLGTCTASTDLITTGGSRPHGLRIGDLVYINSTGRSELDDKYLVVATVPSTTTFKVTTREDYADGDSDSVIDIAGDTSGAGFIVGLGPEKLRSDSGSNVEEEQGVAKTHGQEQYLEVRMAIKPLISYVITRADEGDDNIVIDESGANRDLDVLEGDLVYISGLSTSGDAGTTLNGKYWIVTNVQAATFQVSTPGAATVAAITWTGDDTGGTVVNYGNPKDILVGYGGNFVYLICNKHLRA